MRCPQHLAQYPNAKRQRIVSIMHTWSKMATYPNILQQSAGLSRLPNIYEPDPRGIVIFSHKAPGYRAIYDENIASSHDIKLALVVYDIYKIT